MRMRKKKHSDERLAAVSHLLCRQREEKIASPLADFGREGEIRLEIGCGKGGFACEMAAENPAVCFYAMEKIPNVMIAAAERAEAEKANRPADNLRFIIANADMLEEWFVQDSISVLYLNFSDPWPKERHAKRRLTHRRYLEAYFRVLKKDGVLRFKTDNAALFDFTLAELADMGVTPEIVTRDLHNSPYNAGNVMTEYEKNFSSQGYPIHMLTVKNPGNVRASAPLKEKDSSSL